MTLVIDASSTATWAFTDEKTLNSEDLLTQVGADGAIVPAIWPAEVANVLLAGERRQRIERLETERFLGMLGTLPIEVDADGQAVVWNRALALAREQRLSVYDAAYLELAMRRSLTLATSDKALQAAARRVGVEIA